MDLRQMRPPKDNPIHQIFRDLMDYLNGDIATLRTGVVRNRFGHPILKIGPLTAHEWGTARTLIRELCAIAAGRGDLTAAINSIGDTPCRIFCGPFENYLISVARTTVTAPPALLTAALMAPVSRTTVVADYIQRCQWSACDRFFMAKSKRGARFCSTPCRWAEGNAKRKKVSA
jgi:hypothetical protein